MPGADALGEMLHRYDSGDKDKVPSEHAFTSVITSRSPPSKDRGKGTVCFDSMLQRWQAGQESLDHYRQIVLY
jgi:hypothetical protein